MNSIRKQWLVYGAAAVLAMVSEGVVHSSPIATGTGFFITGDGYLISNYHVVKDAMQVRVVTSNATLQAKVAQVDATDDLALLKVEGNFSPLPIAASRTVSLGATVATIGFPDIGLQGFAPKLAKGEIASLSGAGDNPRYFQISAPVQPGNSGGALVDEHGNVVGIVSAKLNEAAALAVSGALPENVNYAVKSSLLLSFLASVPEVSAKLKEPNTGARTFEDVVKSAEDAAVLVLVTRSSTAQETTSDRVASGGVQNDGGAQATTESPAAAEFEREFYARYPDLKPYEVIAKWTANQLTANGLRGTKDQLIEAFATGTRGEIQRLYQRIEEIKNRVNNPTPLPQPPNANFPAYGGVNVNRMVDYIMQQNAAADTHQQRMAAYDEIQQVLQQETAKYVLGGQMGLGQAAILALATPEEIAAAAAAKELAAQREQQKIYLSQSNAIRWLQLQASNGDASAQCSLGLHYLNGLGCETNPKQAIYWLQKAAEQGNLEASNKLVRLKK
jgi:S1-C subfamily serine protease